MSNNPRFRQQMREEAVRIGVSLNSAQMAALEVHYRLLSAWGARMNLTAIRGMVETVRRHFGEGLVAGDLLAREGARGTLLDLGSGNGFPGVPIRIACPGIKSLVLVESSAKRSGFLRALIRELKWDDSRVEMRRAERAEDLRDLACEIFVTRGVTMFHLVREGLPFLRPGGLCLLFSDRKRFDEAVPELPGSLGWVREEPLPDRNSSLLLLRKIGR